MAAALSTTLPGTSSAPGAAGLGYDTSGAVWRPRGVLVAHLAEHRQVRLRRRGSRRRGSRGQGHQGGDRGSTVEGAGVGPGSDWQLHRSHSPATASNTCTQQCPLNW